MIISKKVILSLATSLVVLTGCKDLEGTMSLGKQIVLKNEDGRMISINPGSYQSQIKIKNKKEFKLEVKVPGKEQKFVFAVNRNLKKIRSGEEISVSAAESGQPVDIRGIYTSQSHDSGRYSSNEQCNVNDNYPKCKEYLTPGCIPANTPPKYGSRPIEYFDRITDEFLNLKLLKQMSDLQGVVDVSSSSSERIVTYRGTCR